MTALQADLFTDYDALDHQRARIDAMRADLALDCCTGQPLATYTAHDRRCGRCGTPVTRFALTIEHDMGYLGCPVDHDPVYGHLARTTILDHRQDFAGRIRLDEFTTLQTRHDRLHWPDCAGCGCAWGLHRRSATGVDLPAQSSCLAYCGCHGYLAPPRASGPTGRCPGCWGDPHDGHCEVAHA